ncbi:MAG TPA: nitroreductase family protein [Spirochaetia bacterium]|nr:nitroreductase family protein [Spirochaetia bacterium]
MNEVLKLMRQRQSDRLPFDQGRKVTDRDLKLILEAGRWAPTAHNMQNYQVVAVDDRIILSAIEAINRPISDAFIQENSRQLSSSEEELVQKKVGLLASLFPPYMRMGGAVIPSKGMPLLPTPLLLFVLYDPRTRAPASEGDFLGIMSIGCVMENMWLAAQSLGISFQIVSSTSAPESTREIRKLLGIPQELHIAFSARLGYPTVSRGRYLRVRRNIEDFAHRNRFGVPFGDNAPE